MHATNGQHREQAGDARCMAKPGLEPFSTRDLPVKERPRRQATAPKAAGAAAQQAPPVAEVEGHAKRTDIDKLARARRAGRLAVGSDCQRGARNHDIDHEQLQPLLLASKAGYTSSADRSAALGMVVVPHLCDAELLRLDVEAVRAVRSRFNKGDQWGAGKVPFEKIASFSDRGRWIRPADARSAPRGEEGVAVQTRNFDGSEAAKLCGVSL